jgi:hypothetical protein
VNLDNLRLIRNILLRSFVVAAAFALLMLIVTLGFWKVWVALTFTFFHTDEAYLSAVILAFFTAARFFVLFLLLTPALAIQWTIKSELARKPAN